MRSKLARVSVKRMAGPSEDTVAEETHLAHNCMRHGAPHAKAFPVALSEVDRKVAGGHKMEGIGGLALAIEDL